MNEPVFKRKALYTAVCAALASPLVAAPMLAHAAVTAQQVPGNGYVVQGAASASVSTSTNLTTETVKVGETSAATTGVIIQWGGTAPSGATALSGGATTAGGFNVGTSASVIFNNSGTGAGPAAAILNIDASGNPSVIDGSLSETGAAAPMYIANANGIMVGGTGATITAPGGLGLINAGVGAQAQSVFENSGNPLPVDFVNVPTGNSGIDIATGADLRGVSNFLFVAGAGNVNLNDAVFNGTSHGIPTGAQVVVDGGFGGVWQATTSDPSFTVYDQGSASPLSAMTSGGYTSGGGFYYQDAPGTTVNLNLGTTTAPYEATSLGVVVNGNINVASSSDITSLGDTTLQWVNGTLTNNGILDFSTTDSTAGKVVPTTADADLYLNSTYGTLYGNSTAEVNGLGAFVNASGAMVNAGSLDAEVASFTNAGTIQLGQSSDSVPYLSITATKGDINFGGNIVVAPTGTGYTGSLFLGDVSMEAVTSYGQSITFDPQFNSTSTVIQGNKSDNGYSSEFEATNVSIGTGITNVADDSNGSVEIAAQNATVSVPIMLQQVTTAGGSTVTSLGGSFYFEPLPGQVGTFDLTSNGGISADSIWMGTTNEDDFAFAPVDAPYASVTGQAKTNFVLDGSVNAGSGTVAFGGYTTSIVKPNLLNGSKTNLQVNPAGPQTGDVSGSGSITAGYLAFANLVGSVNNIHTDQILANGFQVNAPSSQPIYVAVYAGGVGSQGFNLAINGSANLYSATPAATYQTSSGYSVSVLSLQSVANVSGLVHQQPANADSNFVVNATGNLTVGSLGNLVNSNLAALGLWQVLRSQHPGSLVSNTYNLGDFEWPGLVYMAANGSSPSGNLTINTTLNNAFTVSGTTGAVGMYLLGNSINDQSPIYTNGNAGVVFANASYGVTSVNGQPAQSGMPTVYFATGSNPTYTFSRVGSSSPDGSAVFTNAQGYLQQWNTFYSLNTTQQPTNTHHTQ